jgi:hypothetical protein
MSRFNCRDSSRENGTKNWKITRKRPTYPQPPLSRRMYQVISSGRLPAQMISHCDANYAEQYQIVNIGTPHTATEVAGG